MILQVLDFLCVMITEIYQCRFVVITEGSVFQISVERVQILLRLAAIDRFHVSLYLNIIDRLFYSRILSHLIQLTCPCI